MSKNTFARLVSVLPALALVALVGCATIGTIKKAPLDKGEARVFLASHDQVFAAGMEAMDGHPLDFQESYEVDGSTSVIISTTKSGGATWGEIVRLTVHELSENKTIARVVTKKRAAMNVGAVGDRSPAIFMSIELKLRDIEGYEPKPAGPMDAWAALEVGMNPDQVVDLLGVPSRFEQNAEELSWFYSIGTVFFEDASGVTGFGGRSGKLKRWVRNYR